MERRASPPADNLKFRICNPKWQLAPWAGTAAEAARVLRHLRLGWSRAFSKHSGCERFSANC